MKGIITHEASQEVTKAFREKGLEFYSNDLIDCYGSNPEWHIKGDVFHVLCKNSIRFSFQGSHPVCRYLANSGVKHLTRKKITPGFVWSEKYQIYMNMDRYEKMKDAALHFKSILSWVETTGKGYVENPIMHKYAMEIIGVKPTQIIQPWMFGHTTSKATCLWIIGLPKLTPTDIISIEKRTFEIHLCPPGPNREKIRSKTFPGIAKAMAEQWSEFLTNKSKSMKVTPIENFGNSLTKGRSYQVITRTESNTIIVDDTGTTIGYSNLRFENVTDDLDVFGWELCQDEEISSLETIKMEMI